MQQRVRRFPRTLDRLVLSSLILVSANLIASPIQFPDTPSLSPNGNTIYFSWNGDLWTVPVNGGIARQITTHPADDSQPHISPDGKKLAFISDRSGHRQVYVADLEDPDFAPVQITHHTAGYRLEDWFPDGDHLLVSSQQDEHWRHANRLFKLSLIAPRESPRQLFNAYASAAKVSPDGKKILFNREGYRWWRKGYQGSKAAQIWTYDLASKQFKKMIHAPTESLWPSWDNTGNSIIYVGGTSGSFNLWRYRLADQTNTQLTSFTDDSTVFPAISKDGSTAIFRHLSQLYRLDLNTGKAPTRIEIEAPSESLPEDEIRRQLNTADEVAFTKDGLEIAFISGGDVWVMDTELREPKQVTNTVEEEHSLIFGPDDESLYFVSNQNGQSDIWRASRSDTDQYWWLNDQFDLKQLTDDSAVEEDLQLSPTDEWIAYLRKNGDIWIISPDGKQSRMVHPSVLSPDFDWAPDGKWLVVADSDADFNRDIWLVSIEGDQTPFNLSRHPDNEGNPTWSPDGKLIAFTGRRYDQEIDIYFVWLEARNDEQDERDRKLEKALEAMKKHRKKEAPDENKDDAEAKSDEKKATEDSEEASEQLETKIDFKHIHERIRRIRIPNTSESRLFWSHDSKKLAFQANIEGKSGTYTISIPEDLKPKLLTDKTGTQAVWIKRENQILWLADKKPSRLLKSGKLEPLGFQVKQSLSRSARYKAAFEEAWRLMRDNYYDANLGNKNWQSVRRKYAPLAEAAIDESQLTLVIQLMLGELNGSHLGFYPSNTNPWKPESDWNISTAHLGLRFDVDFKGPGLKVRDRLPGGPSDQADSTIEAGETILRIDGNPVDSTMDLTPILNGPSKRTITLRVSNTEGEERDVTVTPISYSQARSLLYRKWIEDNRRMVKQGSEDSLGYLHVRAMNWPSFQQFERDIYAAGAGKEGLIIDVRENGGGFTTDHLLTVLTQPEHAITVPRDGGRGYPQDRSVYATWKKPIIVLCNQNSFSNAEIFSHAIKHLKRGQLVGVTTAGGVISTGSAQVMDVGRIRIPFRGWYLAGTGEDMELHGAEPDHTIWPHPGDLPAGVDKQLDKAIQLLLEEVEAARQIPSVQLKKASERQRD